MIINFANFLLISLIILSFYNFLFLSKNALNNDYFARKINIFVSLIFIISLLIFLLLILAYVISDFSILNVYLNSHPLKPLIYKISGAWGNHEGSMLLWQLILSTYSFSLIFQKNISYQLKTWTLAFQNIIIFNIALYIFFASNPFIFVGNNNTGLGLNPILQDVGLSIHPPILYLGYVGSSILFSGSIAILLEKNFEHSFLKLLEKYCRFTWGCLTLGIMLGAWWAYRELGWGGYWFWDPVENISLLPWLALTSLLHAIIASRKSKKLIKWTIILSIITFILSLLGTFLVRSGIITSVHSFASDPERGIFILAFISFISLLGIFIYIKNINKIHEDYKIKLLSREFFILLNNIILLTACFTVLIGIMYPLIFSEIFNQYISVGANYYSSIFKILTIFLFSIINIGIFLAWNNTSINKLKIKNCIFKFIIAGILVYIIVNNFILLDIILLLLIIYFIISLGEDLFSKYINQIKITYAYFNIILVHLFFALTVIFIILNNHYQLDKELNIKEKDTIEFAEHIITLHQIDFLQEKNYLIKKAEFAISGRNNFILYPEQRFYPVENSHTSEADIYHNLFYDFYVVIGDNLANDNLSARLYYRPFIFQIWFFTSAMILCVFLSLFIKTRRNANEKIY